MFTGEIANLASLWCTGVAWRRLAADEGVKMGQSAVAIAGRVDGHSVDVVYYIGQLNFYILRDRTHGMDHLRLGGWRS